MYNKASNIEAFRRGDGSEDQRAYDIATTIKHWGGRIKKLQPDERYTIPLWLSNNGFQSILHSLSYVEFSSITREIGRTADVLEKPGVPKE